MTTALITGRVVSSMLLALALTLLLPACGRSVLVTVVDEQSGKPVSATILHGRTEWRFLSFLPLQQEITRNHGQTDASGRIMFEDVRDSDVLTVVGSGVQRTWFTPLRPVIKTRLCLISLSGHTIKLGGAGCTVMSLRTGTGT
jgi:hypothetical protein